MSRREPYLGHFQCATSDYDAKTEPFGESILQAFNLRNVEIVNKHFIAVLPDEGLGRPSQKPRNVMGKSSHLYD